MARAGRGLSAVRKWSVFVAFAVWGSSTRAQNPWVSRNRNRGDAVAAETGGATSSSSSSRKTPESIGKIRVAEDGATGTTEGAFGGGGLSEQETDFAKLHKLVEQFGATDERGGAAHGGENGVDAGAAMAQVAEMWENLMESEEMQTLLSDPEALRSAILDNPFLKAVPGAAEQLDAVMRTEAFQDPDKFKEAVKTGMDAFKAVSQEMVSEIGTQLEDLIAHPEKLEATMTDALAALGLDADALAAAAADGTAGGLAGGLGGLGGLGGGDEAAAEALLRNVPGMEDIMSSPDFKKQMEQAQDLLASMLAGGDSSSSSGGGAGGAARTNHKKKRPKLDLDEVEIDAINGAF